MDPFDDVDRVASRIELASFLDALARRVEDSPEEFENVSLPRFLEAAAAWVRDMDGYFANQGEVVPDELSWSLVAAIFDTATIYE